VRDVELTDRQRRVLLAVAQHGVLDTAQVAVLLTASRPTAHRLLDGLHACGLLARHGARHGRHHRWYYTVSTAGGDAILATQRGAAPVVRTLEDRRLDLSRQYQINRLFVDLVAYGHRHGQAELYRWWHRVDAMTWLAELGIDEPRCDGRGIWIENATTVRFLLHWTLEQVYGFYANVRLAPKTILAQYAEITPADALLVVVANLDGERAMHEHAAEHPVGMAVATTTPALLDGHDDGAAGPVWATNADAIASSRRHRLIDVHASR
jgi:hypothetical protein